MPSANKKPSAADVAAGFSITGLLDASAKTRERFPVAEIAIADIADHPGNIAYSMDAAGIQSLASSILRDGLTDLPLVRKMDDGSWQMISGHRRKAAYSLLARDDARFEKMPCRIIERISNGQAETLLHTANYFVRQLSVTERAAATRALGAEARRMLADDPAFKGKKADVLLAFHGEVGDLAVGDLESVQFPAKIHRKPPHVNVIRNLYTNARRGNQSGSNALAFTSTCKSSAPSNAHNAKAHLHSQMAEADIGRMLR